MATPRIGPDIVSKQQALTGFDVSRDGETIVFARREVVRGEYVAHLWRVATAGGRPERLTSAKGLDGSPRISPDGASVLFMSNRGDRKKSQPWVLPLGGGEARMLCELKHGVSAGVWSPDGRTVALTAASGVERYLIGKRTEGKDPTGRAIRDVFWRYDGTGILDQHPAVWTVPSGGGTAKRRTSPEHGVEGVMWSPDGARIGFLADRRPERTIADHPQVWSIPAAGGAPTKISPDGQVVVEAAWGPGGVAWRGWQAAVPAWHLLNVWAKPGRDVVLLAPGRDLFVGPVGYSELTADAEGACLAWLDDDHVVAIAAERGISLPWRLGLDGSAECLAPGVSAGCVTLRVAGERVFVVASVDGDVGELHEVEDGRLRRIPRGTGRWFAPYRQEKAERITVKRRSLPDVDGWLVRARTGRDPRPLIVRPHGGPFDAFGPVSRFEDLALAARGYHVLRPNPRGSVSYGEDFAKALHGVWGDPDSEDIFALVDRLVRDGVADRSRLGVMGLSYGGFMTHWLLANFPGRFKVGVSENPFTTVMADYGAGDSAEDIEEGMGLPPWPDVAEWHARSPVFTIARSRAPLLLLVSEGDLRCPPIHSEIAFTALRMAGVTAEMVRYPGEYHVMFVNGRPDRRIDRLERILDWFGRYL